MDFTELIGPIVSAILAIFGAYQATKTAAEEREREMERRMNERDSAMKSDLASLTTKVDLLSERVEKHNNLIERTAQLETEVTNLYHRFDDMKGMKKGA